MKNIKLIIAYDGARYNGWQKQGNTDNTIQAKLENTIGRMLEADIEISASGRTDAGVHAIGQVANFHVEEEAIDRFAVMYKKEFGKKYSNVQYGDGKYTDSSCDNISYSDNKDNLEIFMHVLNDYLPRDIRIISVSYAGDRFHARLNARGKHYSYRIDNKPVADIFDRKYLVRIEDRLNIEDMKAAAERLKGEHDFIAFSSNKRMKKSSVRIITDIDISDNDGIIRLDFFGNGFLYNMVRIMVGTLIEVGLGKREPKDIDLIFASNERACAGYLAPANGLFLEQVFY